MSDNPSMSDEARELLLELDSIRKEIDALSGIVRTGDFPVSTVEETAHLNQRQAEILDRLKEIGIEQ
jgi:hypothetical protein